MAIKKVLDEQTLQALLQLIAVEIKKKADNGHIHSQYVTTTALNSMLDNINSFEVLVVDSLPVENIDNHTIYLVQKNGETNDAYDEWMYINGAWEHIGNTIIDLSEYAKTSEVNNLLEGKSDKEHTHEINEVNGLQTALNNKANETHTHAIGDVDGLQTALNGKADAAHKHTMEELSNVNVTNIKDGEVLKYNTATGKWVNSSDISGTDGTTDYNNLSNKPKVNGVELTGNKTGADLGLAGATHTHAISDVTNLQTELDKKLNSDDLQLITKEEATSMWNTSMSE